MRESLLDVACPGVLSEINDSLDVHYLVNAG